MMQWGLIKRTRVIGNTFFGFKPETANFGRFSAKSCFEIVSQVGAERDAYVAKLRDEYRADIDLMKLAAELVIDAVIPGDRLRAELIARFGAYANRASSKVEQRPKKKHPSKGRYRSAAVFSALGRARMRLLHSAMRGGGVTSINSRKDRKGA